MKKDTYITVALAVIPIAIAGFLGFTNLKGDVRLVEQSLAAGEKNYQSLDRKVGAIQLDLRRQGTSQAVTAQKVEQIKKEIEKLERSSSESNREQTELLRELLRQVGQ